MNATEAALKLWPRYFLSLRPEVPGFGQLEDADCIFVQAFGRNKYNDEELGSFLHRLRVSTRDSDLETFFLLKQQGFDPGASNRALGVYAVNMFYRLGRVPIITQWEVAYAIFEMDVEWYMRNQIYIDCLWPSQEGYFATAHVKQASKKHMERRGKSHPLELAHPAMTTRAIPIIWGTGITPIVEHIPHSQIKTHPLWVWDANSVQEWTRSWENWRIRELIGRVAHVGSWGLARIHILDQVRAWAPKKYREQIPGDWVAIFPPEPMV